MPKSGGRDVRKRAPLAEAPFRVFKKQIISSGILQVKERIAASDSIPVGQLRIFEEANETPSKMPERRNKISQQKIFIERAPACPEGPRYSGIRNLLPGM